MFSLQILKIAEKVLSILLAAILLLVCLCMLVKPSCPVNVQVSSLEFLQQNNYFPKSSFGVYWNSDIHVCMRVARMHTQTVQFSVVRARVMS